MPLLSRRKSLASHIRLALVLITGLLSVGALGMLMMTRRASQEASRLYEARLLPLMHLETVAEAYAISMTGALRQVRAGDMPPSVGLQKLHDARARADVAWQRYRSNASSAAQSFRWEALEARRAALNQLQAPLEALVTKGMTPELGAFGDHQWIPAVNLLVNDLEEVRAARLVEAQHLSEDLAAAGRRATLSGLALMGSAALIAILTSHLFALRISQGALSLVGHLRRLADGDLSSRAPVDGEDEFAQAQRELDRTTFRLRTLVEDLKAQQALEQAILDGAQVAIIGIDLHGKVSRWGRGAEALLGYTAEEVIGIHSPDLWRDPSELESLRLELERRLGRPVGQGTETFQAVASIPGYLVDCHYIHKLGHRIPVLLSISSIKTPDGQVLGTMGVSIDMRQVRALEAELGHQERQYRGLVERIPGVVFQWLMEPNGQRSVPFVGPQIQPLLGLTPEAFQADPQAFGRLLFEDDRAFFEHLFRQASDHLSPLEWEGRSRTAREDETRWLRLRANPSLQPDGAILWDGLLEDLSHLKDTENALVEAEERWKLALDANRDGIWDFHVEKNSVWFSPRYTSMLGYSEEDLSGDISTFHRLVHPDDVDECRRLLSDFLAGQQDRYQQEFRMLHRDGTWRWILNRASALRNSQGRIIRVVGSHADITQQRQQELALKESEARAQSASRAKSAFLANMSHELRTPLSAILGYARLLDREHWRTDEERFQLQHILHAGEHLLSLINDVLSLSKIEAGRIDFRPAPFRPNDLFNSLRGLFELTASGKGLRFHIECDAFPTLLEGDVSKLRQVLVNLIGNAIKFTEQGYVRLSAAWKDERATFRVEDSGPGISLEDQARLFEAFSQTDQGMAAGGTGLGLHISRALVRLMGGDIDLVSDARGSRFSFSLSLPIAKPTSSVAETRDVMKLADGQGEPRLLVVDDRPENRDVLERLLSLVGFRVTTAEDGTRALSRWAAERPDLILMDLRMPNMDGFQATAAIRAQEEAGGLPRTPILAISASVYDTTLEELRAQGFDDFVTKPIDESALFDSLGRLLHLRFDTRVSGPSNTIETDLKSLQKLPLEWRERFKECVARGDLSAAEGLLAELSDAPLIFTLTKHLRAYHLQELLDHLG